MWRIWAVDYFDQESAPSLEEEGAVLADGFESLWGKVLEEGIMADGRPTFTWFELRLEGDPAFGHSAEKLARIPRDPLMNVELGRIRGWRGVVGLIPAVARAHIARLDSGGAERILAAAREAGESAVFLERVSRSTV